MMRGAMRTTRGNKQIRCDRTDCHEQKLDKNKQHLTDTHFQYIAREKRKSARLMEPKGHVLLTHMPTVVWKITHHQQFTFFFYGSSMKFPVTVFGNTQSIA